MLVWAVERAGNDVFSYSEKDAKFRSWMEGTKKPTWNELQKFAQKFYVPLGYLLLPNPPEESDTIPLFRSVDDKKMGLNIRDAVKNMEEKQDWLTGYLQSQGFTKLDYVGIYNESSTVDEICCKIRDILRLSVNWAFDYKRIEDALNYLTRTIEDKGVMVCFNSVVGFNNSRPIPVNDCRGFALVNEYAPFIFVNSKDAKSAQVFTLIHEFAHVLTGYSAGIGGNENMIRTSALEKLCDQVAASLLVNADLLKEEWAKTGENYGVLAKMFKVSRFVIARRAKEIGLIGDARYFALYKQWMEEPLHTAGQSSGGQFYASAIKKCSRTFLIHLDNALSTFKVSNMEAYRLAGLKGDTFRQVIKKI